MRAFRIGFIHSHKVPRVFNSDATTTMTCIDSVDLVETQGEVVIAFTRVDRIAVFVVDAVPTTGQHNSIKSHHARQLPSFSTLLQCSITYVLHSPIWRHFTAQLAIGAE